MGIGIVAPKTAITALILKLHLSHKRMKSENVKMLKIIENNLIIETGSKGGRSGAGKTNESRPKSWIENTTKMLDDREESVQNEEKTKITDNKTIIEHDLEHAKKKLRPKGIEGKTNHFRLWKNMFFYARLWE